MKTSLTIFLVLLMPLVALAQNDDDYVNGLKTKLANAANDSIRLEINRQLGFYFQDGSADIGLAYHQAQLALAKNLNLKLWEADAYQQVGYCYARIWNFPASYESYMNGLKIAEDPSSSEHGWGYHNFSFSKSPEDARQSIIGMIHFEISVLYERTRSSATQLYHLNEALKIGKKLQNKKILTLTTRDIGVYHFMSNQPDSAFKYFKKALEYYEDSPYQSQSGTIYQLISKYYIEKQNYDSAMFYTKKAIASAVIDNKPATLTGGFISLGAHFIQTGQLDSAIYYTQKGIETGESINALGGICAGRLQLAAIYKSQGNYLLAFDFLESGTTLFDSLNDNYINRLLEFQNLEFDQQMRLQELEKENELTKSRFRMYGLLVGLGIFLLVAALLYRNNRVKQKANKVLTATLSDLKKTQTQLVQSEKMASLGELTAGIAHEIQNPLNFVNNFSEVSTELVDEMNEELEKGNIADAKEIAADLKQNLVKINHHGKRAGGIVKGMLAHSRSGKGEKEPTDINAMAEEYLKLSYHGLRAKNKSFNADFKTDFDPNLPKVNVVPQDLGRVMLNLVNNAFQACAVAGIEKPTVLVSTRRLPEGIEISVKDNGPGISDAIRDKIFQPFFTTKPTGQGTGLGLSLSYDIVKAHGGEIKVEGTQNEGSTFIIQIPINE